MVSSGESVPTQSDQSHAKRGAWASPIVDLIDGSIIKLCGCAKVLSLALVMVSSAICATVSAMFNCSNSPKGSCCLSIHIFPVLFKACSLDWYYKDFTTIDLAKHTSYVPAHTCTEDVMQTTLPKITRNSSKITTLGLRLLLHSGWYLTRDMEKRHQSRKSSSSCPRKTYEKKTLEKWDKQPTVFQLLNSNSTMETAWLVSRYWEIFHWIITKKQSQAFICSKALECMIP